MKKTEPSPCEARPPAQPEALLAGQERSASSPWLLGVHIGLVATLMPLLVRFLPLKLLLRLLTPPAWLVPYRRTAPNLIAERVALRLREPRVMRRRACLRHGLTLFHFLRLASAPAVLRIGVFSPQPQAQRMHAHCWVTLQEVCLSPPPAVPTTTLLVWEGASRTCRH